MEGPAEQARAAKRLLEARKPARVVVFGGECSVDFAPFAYLNERYGGELVVVWIDAHSDVATPENIGDYPNFHGMVLSALMGIGEAEFVAEVSRPIDAERVMYVGLRAFMEPLEDLQQQFGISIPNARVEQVEENSDVVLDWLRDINASKVAVHFDLDVLDPAEFGSTAYQTPDGLKVETAVRLLNDISRQVDIVGLGITEYLPRDAILLSDMLRRMPLVNETPAA